MDSARPRIIYLHQYYRTPEQGGSLRSYHFCNALIENGYQIDLITTHQQPIYHKQEQGLLTIHRLPVSYQSSHSYARRAWAFCSYMAQAWVLAMRLPAAQLCYASSTPLTVGLLALLLCRLRHLPYIFEVRDLWPEAPIELGIVKNPLYIKSLFWLQSQIYGHARAIVALSPPMQAGVRTKTQTPAYMIANISDCDFFDPSQSFLATKSPKLWPSDKHIICYTGTLNYANGLESLIDLAAWFNHQPHLSHTHFVVAGEGFFELYLREKTKKLNLNNITFLGNVNKFMIRQLLHDSALAYISFLPIDILGTNSPNKFFDALAAGLPVCINVKGWIAPLIQAHESGFYADPQRPDLFFECYEKYVLDKNIHIQMKINARTLALSDFDLATAKQDFIKIVEMANK